MKKLLKIIGINIKSLVPKIEELKHYLWTHDINVINIEESWINKYTPVVKGY